MTTTQIPRVARARQQGPEAHDARGARREVRARGGTPFVIPESGATVTGALGYLTCAGLLMAKQLAGLRAQVVSILIAWDSGTLTGRDGLE